MSILRGGPTRYWGYIAVYRVKSLKGLLGDNFCDLPVISNPSISLLTVNLPSSASVLPSPPSVASTSSKTTSELWDKGKVPEVILPQPSTNVIRTPQLPHSPGSPKKQNFGPTSLTAGSHPEIMKCPISHAKAISTSDSCPEVIEPSNDTSIALVGEPPAIPTFDITIPCPEQWAYVTHLDRRSGHHCLSCVRCSSKKIRCQPASLGTPPKHIRVPHAALDVPILDLHSMAIMIQDNSPANATFLLNQSVPPPSMSPLPSTLPNLINLDIGVMEPTPLKVEDGSDMVGLMFQPSQVQPEVPDDLGNLFPEYNSVSEEMDVEVKAGPSGGEVEIAT
ncbi:hypothetical protein EDD22DRAFT_856276 [Suillus occidentalis]|nr:hypothetical protein EDD22DRAFT_856276 [Suillus occidentalis]